MHTFLRGMSVAVLALAITITPFVSHAQSADVADLVSRMKAIVAEMDSLKREFESLQTQVSAPSSTPAPATTAVSGSVLGAATTNLQTAVVQGATNGTIEKVQRLLATDTAIYDHPFVTGFYGPATESAIKRLQTRFDMQPVGVVGPATAELLLGYFLAYPSENYPANVLSTRAPAVSVPTPAVQGVSTSQTPSATTPTTSTRPSSNPAEEILVEFDEGEAFIEIEFENGDDRTLAVDTEEQDEVVDYIVRKTDLTKAQVEAVIEFEKIKRRSSGADEDDAENALEDAEDAIDDAADEIEEADDDGDDVDWAEDTLDDAEDKLEEAEEAYDDGDYNDAVELAEEAEELAEEAIDRIDEEQDDDDRDRDRDGDDIDEIEAVITEDGTEVTVEYDDGTDRDFDVDEDDEDDIIEEIADELDIDEDVVEDLIEFEYDFGDLDEIVVEIDEDEGESFVKIFFEDETKAFTTDETDEDDIIEEIADRYDLDEDDIEDVIEFDYR